MAPSWDHYWISQEYAERMRSLMQSSADQCRRSIERGNAEYARSDARWMYRWYRNWDSVRHLDLARHPA